MNYFGENDYEISYNTNTVRNYLYQADVILEDLCKNVNYLVYFVEELEKSAHDKDGTLVAEDYRDFETILGSDGLNKFINDMKEIFDTLENSMNNYERIVRENQERRRREEEQRRLEEQKKASDISFKID